jgi:hypothetical protein
MPTFTTEEESLKLFYLGKDSIEAEVLPQKI